MGKLNVQFVIVMCVGVAARGALGATVWSAGPNDLVFTQSGLTPVDLLTSNVGITRGSTQGIYNSVSEPFYSHLLSPAGTEWAFADLGGNAAFLYGAGASGHAGLTFGTWEGSLGGTFNLQFNIVNRPGVVHLITDDIYVDIRFSDWGSHGGGGFTYQRGVAPPAGPVNAVWDGSTGNWTSATGWSIAPAFPQNSSGAKYTAVLNAGVVSLDVNVAIHNLTVGRDTNGTYTAMVNLADKKLTIASENAGDKPAKITALKDAILAGKGTGNWMGNGITSATVAGDATGNTTVTLVDNADLGLTSFGGMAVNANAILVTRAVLGDADLSGIVDAADFDVWFRHVGGSTYSAAAGDLDLSGIVDAADFDVWFKHVGLSGGPAAVVAVPEGGTLGVLLVGVLGVAGWGRSSRKRGLKGVVRGV